MERDNFINEILNSTNGMLQAQPSADLFSRIEQRIHEKTWVPAKTIWWVAASIAILVAINISALNSNKKSIENQTASSFAAALDKSNQLY